MALKRVMQIFIDDTIFEKQRVGGISRYFCELIKELAVLPKVEVVLYVGDSSNVYLESLNDLRSVKVLRFRNRFRLPKNVFRFFSSMVRKRCFARHCRGSDSVIYHASYFHIDAFIRKSADATVITVHDLIFERLNGDYRPRKVGRRRAIQDQADRILTVSESTAADLSAFNPTTADKIVVTKLAAAVFDEDQSSMVFPQSFLLFVGLRRGYKRGEHALRAFHELINLGDCKHHLLFVGGRSFTRHEIELIEALGLTEHVSQANLSDADLHRAYTMATGLVFPSDYEGFGLPVLEAIHYGCPVIAQKVSSIPEVGGDWPVYFDSAEAGSLTRAMTWVCREGREQIAQDRSEARARQIDRFSWKKTAADTYAAYQKSLKTVELTSAER